MARTLGRLAQLVQSTCLTSRGSLVRTQYLPPKPSGLKDLLNSINLPAIVSVNGKNLREISSAGSEHLPYKQGVTGSNPVSPTKKSLSVTLRGFFI
jgi:hypothetical protein